MRIEKVITEDYAILQLKGEFDTIYYPRFNEEVNALLEGGTSWIVLNLRFVRFINSTALGAIIKAKKSAMAQDGDLVISHPSAFCKDILEKVGLDRIIKIFEDDEGAVAHILERLEGERDPVEQSKESPLLFWFADAEKNSRLPKHVALARLLGLDENTIECVWDFSKTPLNAEEALQLFEAGADFRVKFRIPMFSKEYFEIDCACREAKLMPEQGIQFIGRFTRIDDATRDQIGQFLQDMRFLKDTLKEETKG